MKKLNIHFVGIGGSGISGISVMANRFGHKVTGCDQAIETDYLNEVKEDGIEVLVGHDESHVNNADLMVISPALLYQNLKHPEIEIAKKTGKLLTWQEFLGKYLLTGKEIICVAGTHGKSTTTALAGLTFEEAELDPNVVVGAKVREWRANFRVGYGKHFIVESDEFNNNFLNYSPSTIILNNIEFDHPDFFKSYEKVLDSFEKFVKSLTGKKNLIVNQDSPGIKDLFERLGSSFTNEVNVFGYTLNDNPVVKLENSVKVEIFDKSESKTEFGLNSNTFEFDSMYSLNIPGEHNVANSAGVIILSEIYKLDKNVVKKVLADFEGIGRRLELLGEKNGIKVYDDYAHHPTAIRATIEALRQKHPENRIWVINEPHSYSRTKELLKEYRGAFEGADKVIIAPIYKARDSETFGITEEILANAAYHGDIVGIEDNNQVLQKVKEAKEGDVILVMGAGKSYQLARDILDNL